MPLIGSVNEMVKLLLPYLTVTDDDAIELWKQVTFVLLQPCTLKVTPDLENEATYSLIQKALVADLVALQMLISKSIATTTGSSSESVYNTAGATFLKKAKAGTAEAEFDLLSKNNYNLSQDAKDIYMGIVDLAKMKALALGCNRITILFGMPTEYLIIPPFIVIPDCE